MRCSARDALHDLLSLRSVSYILGLQKKDISQTGQFVNTRLRGNSSVLKAVCIPWVTYQRLWLYSTF